MEPFLLLNSGTATADFRYATGFEVGDAAYIRFADGDDVLLTSALELDRARAESRAKQVLNARDVAWEDGPDPLAAWAAPIAKLAGERGVRTLRVQSTLAAAAYEALRQAGLELRIDPDLLVAERRRKTKEELSWIHAAQRAAEAACVDVIGRLAGAEIRDGLLWDGGEPLTSEHLIASATNTLQEIGYTGPEMIVAGSPGSGLPHFRGEGQIRAGAPVVIDIFPRGRSTGYHGDLTRTVIRGEIDPKWRRISEAVLAAFDAGVATLRAGSDARAAHRAACQALVDAGFGTTTPGLEGPAGPRMNHSLGHGVGLDVHEAPYLRDREFELQEDDVVTVEPGLYETGAGGIRWEDLGAITATGFKNFTSLPKELDPAAYL